MAKKKGQRQRFLLACPECNRRNYVTTKNTYNDKEKLALNKYCLQCRKATEHKETKLPPSKKQ